MSLGAAYYYFPSKEALVFAYYEDNQADLEAVAAAATGTLRERLGAIFHGKLETIRPQRKMLAAIVQRLVDPSDPVGAFSAQTRAVRDRAMAVLERVLADANVPAEVMPLATRALWLLQMALMLVYVNDDSPSEQRTHGLVDDALDMIVPMLPMLATPMGRMLADKITQALSRAAII
jgi:AcrR family transcriptional regulator